LLHHVGTNCRTLLLPRERHLDCRLPGCATELCVPADSTVAEVDGLISQRDGAAAHYGATARIALDGRFPGRWIDREGSINCPPQIPDVTPRDLFFWDCVHSERVESLSDLRRRITAAIAAVPVDVLSWVWGEVEFRFDVFRAVSGVHIELH
jgi:hypothetical protein